jgi:cysteine desulfurase
MAARPFAGCSGGIYLGACATSPPATPVLEAMAAAQAEAWANPSSLHGFGLAAAESLERSRMAVAACLGCCAEELVFTSGGSESIHLALLGAAAALPPGRLLISAVEHPATTAAAMALAGRGWEIARLPVDRQGFIDPERFAALLAPPTRLVSLIWGQSEVGTLQEISAFGQRCRQAGVLLHVDAVQVVGHQPVAFAELPVDLLSLTAHKLQGPRGIGALLVRQGLPLTPQIGGGGQETGRRAGTEPVALAAGFRAALELANERLVAHGGDDPLRQLRDALLNTLLQLPGVALSGPDPRAGQPRLPHHLSLLIGGSGGQPLPGRQLVQALWREGYAASSGSACSSGQSRPSAVLEALGHSPAVAGSGLRFSLGPWLKPEQLQALPLALQRARERVEAT